MMQSLVEVGEDGQNGQPSYPDLYWGSAGQAKVPVAKPVEGPILEQAGSRD